MPMFYFEVVEESEGGGPRTVASAEAPDVFAAIEQLAPFYEGCNSLLPIAAPHEEGLWWEGWLP